MPTSVQAQILLGRSTTITMIALRMLALSESLYGNPGDFCSYSFQSETIGIIACIGFVSNF